MTLLYLKFLYPAFPLSIKKCPRQLTTETESGTEQDKIWQHLLFKFI